MPHIASWFHYPVNNHVNFSLLLTHKPDKPTPYSSKPSQVPLSCPPFICTDCQAPLSYYYVNVITCCLSYSTLLPQSPQIGQKNSDMQKINSVWIRKKPEVSTFRSESSMDIRFLWEQGIGWEYSSEVRILTNSYNWEGYSISTKSRYFAPEPLGTVYQTNQLSKCNGQKVKNHDSRTNRV